MRTVGAREANQHFSKLLREVETGKDITITRNGKPVARLLPLRPLKNSKAREKALKDLMAALEKGLNFGGRKFTRDEMHER